MDTLTGIAQSSAIANWGDIPTWALVIVGIAGVITAGYAGKYASKVYNLDLTREKDRSLQEISAQANLVSVWAEVMKTPISFSEFYGVVAIAKNESNQPIYNVVIMWFLDEKNLYQESANLIPPKNSYTWPVQGNVFKGAVEVDAEGHVSLDVAMSIIKRTRISVTFQDAANRQWIRRQDGLLVQFVGPTETQ